MVIQEHFGCLYHDEQALIAEINDTSVSLKILRSDDHPEYEGAERLTLHLGPPQVAQLINLCSKYLIQQSKTEGKIA